MNQTVTAGGETAVIIICDHCGMETDESREVYVNPILQVDEDNWAELDIEKKDGETYTFSNLDACDIVSDSMKHMCEQCYEVLFE